jgi:hypothetical protein
MITKEELKKGLDAIRSEDLLDMLSEKISDNWYRIYTAATAISVVKESVKVYDHEEDGGPTIIEFPNFTLSSEAGITTIEGKSIFDSNIDKLTLISVLCEIGELVDMIIEFPN